MNYESLSKPQLLKIIEEIRSPRYRGGASDQVEVVRLLETLLLERLELEAQIQTLKDSVLVVEESLKDYINVFENAPIAYVMLDANGCVLKMNQSACKLTHTESRLLSGLPFSGLLSQSSRRPFLDHFTECQRYKNSVKSVLLDLHSNETVMPMRMTGTCSDTYRGVFVSA
jgi:PAS domain-containing protein